MFRLALNAGHGYNTPGKRCLKAIDPNETREYMLNKRVCDYIEKKLSKYEGIEVLRIDDGSELSVSKRAQKANDFRADLYLAIHHNAGINGGSGGGIEAYAYLAVDEETLDWQKKFYDAAIEKTGLKGNRATPLKRSYFGELRLTKMPAVLLECGFMDSTTDTPIILTEAFAEKVAEACAQTVVKKAKLTLNTNPVKKTVDELAYEVIRGLWGNGNERQKKLTDAGYDFLKVQGRVNEILLKAVTKGDEELAREVIRGDWGNGAERKAKLTAAGHDYDLIQKIVNSLY